MVKVGDSIPDVELAEGSPGNKVNLKEALSKGKGVIVGVPAAFSTFFPSRLFLSREEFIDGGSETEVELDG